MKRSVLLPLSIMILGSFGCKKALDDVMDYYPTVRTESVTANDDGSVTVVGRIVSEGDSPIGTAGFCASQSPVPEMLDAQAIADVQGGIFSATYTGLDPYGTYYFRAWATNDAGYSYGGVLMIDSVTAVPVDPPCTPTANTATLGAGFPTQTYYPIEAMDLNSDFDYTFQANTSSHFITYTFGNALTTGVRTTTAYSDPDPGEVRVSFISGFTSGALSAGSDVYIQQLTPTTWEITICQAPWLYSSSTYYFTTRFVAHL